MKTNNMEFLNKPARPRLPRWFSKRLERLLFFDWVVKDWAEHRFYEICELATSKINQKES